MSLSPRRTSSTRTGAAASPSEAYLRPLTQVIRIMTGGVLAVLFAGVITPPVTAAAKAPPACTSVGIFGVRGSDQKSGFGPEVSAAVQSLEQGLRAAGRTYTEFPLEYTSASVDLIHPGKPHPNGYVWDVKQYAASVEDGTGALYTSLDLRDRNCPTETPVLIGYSQGAMVVRKAMQKLANNGRTSILQRIGGAGLIADPDKQRNEPNIGGAPALSIGVATYFHVGGPVAIPSAVVGRAMNACRYQDIACDFSTQGKTSIHTTYTGTTFPSQLGTWLVKPTVTRSAPPPATGGGATPPPSTTPPPPAVNGQVILAQGPVAPAGYRYAINLTGLAAGSTVPITCYDTVSPAGFYTFSLTTDSAGAASTTSYCYSGDGPDHWVRAGGIESNHVTWTSAPPPPPPAPTYSETVGGLAHTWTNYVNAGGTEGPTIAGFTTVQIACKVQGFRVADGNTWWYRIASAPWNGNFYISADAFFNNGQTSGSLAGTPFVDNAVPDC